MANNELSDELPIAADYQTNLEKESSFIGKYFSTVEPESVNYHKSLDFSNVGSYGIWDESRFSTISTALGKFPNAIKTHNFFDNHNELGMAFRQFHQTRIYIQGKVANVTGQATNTKTKSTFKGIYGHGNDKKYGTYLISANLPETINYSIGSMWDAPLNGLGGSLSSLMVGLLKSGLDVDWLPDSMYNRFQTVKVWNGSKPLNMSITIPVIDDGSFNESGGGYAGVQNGQNTNFAEALEFLGSLCLPHSVVRNLEKSKSVSDDFGFYTPPPSPLQLKAFWNNPLDEKNPGREASFLNANYARIMVQLGGMLLIDNCVITNISVRYNNTKALIRHHYTAEQNGTELDYLTPLIAEVTIDFSTVEALTSEIYSKMLWLRRQPEMGYGALSSRRLQDTLADKLQGIVQGVTNIINPQTEANTNTGGKKG